MKFPLLFVRLYTVSQQIGTYQYGRRAFQLASFSEQQKLDPVLFSDQCSDKSGGGAKQENFGMSLAVFGLATSPSRGKKPVFAARETCSKSKLYAFVE